MATAICTEDTTVCSICYGLSRHSITSRKLPGCNHAFCENCLLAYITNLESSGEDLQSFKCPNCREPIPLPESTEGLKDWVKSLVPMKTNDKMTSEASSVEVCVSCKDVEVSVPAKIYCIECEESLCERCSKIRHRSNVFKEHATFNLENTEGGLEDDGQKKLIALLAELLKCSKHQDKAISCLCKDDYSLCCSNCIVENHRHCDAIVDIQSETFESENESTMKKVKERLEEIVSQIDALVVNRNDNIKEVKQKVETITNKVKEIRTKINDLLDALEENIDSKAKAISKKYAIEVEDENNKLKEIIRPLKDQISVFANALSICSGGQTYIISRKLEQKIEECEKSAFEVFNNFKKYEIGLKINPSLQSWLDLSTNNTDVLAEVTEEVQKMPVPRILQKPQSSHTGVEQVTEYDILPKNAPSDYPEYYGMIYTSGRNPTRRMFLVSKYCSFFCAADNNYKATECFNKEKLTGEPYGLTELKQNVIAVGLPEEKKIVFLSENEESKDLELFGHIDTRNRKPKALCGLSNGDLAISYTEPVGFGILNFKCSLYANHIKERIHFTKDKSGRTLKTFDFMAVDENRSYVIQPCKTDKAVYCFDFDGNPQFKYSDNDLVYPRGVGFSVDGNIFICDQTKSVIHVISPVGQGLQVVREGCPEKPLAIAFDPTGLQFAVSQNTGPWKKVRFFRLTEQIV